MFKLEFRPDWFYKTRTELHLHLRVKRSSKSMIWLCRCEPNTILTFWGHRVLLKEVTNFRGGIASCVSWHPVQRYCIFDPVGTGQVFRTPDEGLWTNLYYFLWIFIASDWQLQQLMPSPNKWVTKTVLDTVTHIFPAKSAQHDYRTAGAGDGDIV